MRKKGQFFNQISGIAVGIVTLAIVIIIALLVVSQGREQVADVQSGTFCTGAAGGDGSWTFNATSRACQNATNNSLSTNANLSAAWNATEQMGEAVSEIPDWVPLVVITIIGSILLGLVSLFRRR